MRKSLTICILLAAYSLYGQAPAELVVLRENVNLRAKPALSAEVVAQVSKPQTLTVKSVSEGWVEVRPPEHASLWVLGDYVQNGVIHCERKVNIRAGAGINFNIVGQLANGEKVDVRGEHADWIKIAPTDTSSLWIARDMIELVEPAAPEIKPQAAAKPLTELKADATTIEPASDPEPDTLSQPLKQAGPPRQTVSPSLEKKPSQPPADLDLHPDKPQGQALQLEGTLRPRSFIFGSPSRYRLTEKRNGGETTICYVRGNEAQLQQLLNRRMLVCGHAYWVKNPADCPVLIPERIMLK